MTKKDFILISSAIASCKRYGFSAEGLYYIGLDIDELLDSLAQALLEDNGQFNASKFRIACNANKQRRGDHGY